MTDPDDFVAELIVGRRMSVDEFRKAAETRLGWPSSKGTVTQAEPAERLQTGAAREGRPARLSANRGLRRRAAQARDRQADAEPAGLAHRGVALVRWPRPRTSAGTGSYQAPGPGRDVRAEDRRPGGRDPASLGRAGHGHPPSARRRAAASRPRRITLESACARSVIDEHPQRATQAVRTRTRRQRVDAASTGRTTE
jgi:hypothetical protein